MEHDDQIVARLVQRSVEEVSLLHMTQHLAALQLEAVEELHALFGVATNYQKAKESPKNKREQALADARQEIRNAVERVVGSPVGAIILPGSFILVALDDPVVSMIDTRSYRPTRN